MKTKTHMYDYSESTNIYNFFKNSMSSVIKSYVSNKDLSNEQLKINRINLLKCYEKTTTEDFLELISKNRIKKAHVSLETQLLEELNEKKNKSGKKNENKAEIQKIHEKSVLKRSENDKNNDNDIEERDMILDSKQIKKK